MARRPSPDHLGWPFWLTLGAVTVAGAVLRWHNIGDRSLWIDEIGEAVVAQNAGTLLAGVRSHIGAAPLDYLGVAATTWLLGSATVLVRFWAFACGALAVFAAGWAGWEVYRSRAAATFAACLLALSSLAVYYSQEARFYSMALLLSLIWIALFARALRQQSWGAWMLLATASAASLYTHYYLAFLLLFGGVAIVISSVVAWTRARETAHLGRMLVGYFSGVGVAVVSFLPWYFYATTHQLALASGGPAFKISDLPPQLLFLVATLTDTNQGWPAVVIGLAFFMAGATLLGLIVGTRLGRPATVAVAMTAFVLAPTVVLADVVGHYWFAVRQVIVVVPMLSLLAGAGLGSVLNRFVPLRSESGQRSEHHRRVVSAGIVGIAAVWLVLQAFPLGVVYGGTWMPKEDWRGAARYLAASACPGSPVLVNVPASYDYGVGFYQPGLLNDLAYLPATNELPLPIAIKRMDARLRDEGDVWIVVYREAPHVFAWGVGGLPEISEHLAALGYTHRDFTPRLRVFAPPKTCG